METFTFGIFFLLLGMTVFNPLLGLYNLLFIAYIRPQDHYEAFADLHPARIVLLLTLLSFSFHQIILQRRWVKAVQNKAILAIWAIIFMSRLWAIDLISWQGAFEDFTRICLVYFMIINCVRTPRQLKFFYAYIVFLYLFVGIRFYYNYKWGTPWYAGSKPGDLSYGFMANADDLGFGVAVALPLVLVPVFYARRLYLKIFSVFASGIFMLSSLGSGSRGAAIGTIWAFLIGIVSQIRWRKLKKQHYLVGTAIVLVLFAGFIERYRWTLLDYKEQILDESDTGRVGRESTWGVAQKMIMARPLLGVGRGQYVAYWEDNYGPGVFGYQVAHNILYEVAAETGLIGLLFFLYFSLYGLYETRLIYKKYGKLFNKYQFYEMLFAVYLVFMAVFYVNGQFITVAFYWHLYLFVALFVCTKSVFINRVVALEKKRAEVKS
jgi:O-antigen ligase